MMGLERVSIGLHGSTTAAELERLAPLIEAAGFRALWLNDTPHGDALAGLAAAASVTSTLRLGVGVIPLDRRDAAQIAEAASDLPADRLDLGVGSGGATDALARVRAGVEHLRAETSATLLVGALGPRMRALAAEIADGVLFNWLTPSAAHDATRQLKAVNPDARAVLYARTALESDAISALAAEAAQYGSYPSYAANFERIGAEAIDTTIVGTTPEALHDSVHHFLRGVDELVLRAIVAPGSDLARFIELAAAA